MKKGIITTLCALTVLILIAVTATGCKDQKADKGTTGDNLANKGTAGDYEYEIEITGSFGEFCDNRGYYIETTDGSDAPCYVIICSGRRTTGGYNIRVDDVGIRDDALLITVEETSPEPYSAVTDAIEFPYCVLKLNKLPEKLCVIDKTGAEFKKYDAFDYWILENLPYRDLRWLEKDYALPEGWVALLKKDYDDITHETYVYKDGTGYKYFNIYVTPGFPDLSELNHRFISENTCSSKEEVINAAKDYGSYGVMVLPDDQSKTYSVNEFISKDF